MDTVDGGVIADWVTGGLGRDVHRGGPGNDHVFSRDGGQGYVDGGPHRPLFRASGDVGYVARAQ